MFEWTPKQSGNSVLSGYVVMKQKHEGKIANNLAVNFERQERELPKKTEIKTLYLTFS